MSTKTTVQQERELDLARLALHLRQAVRAARRLGIRRPGLRPMLAMPMVSELLRVAGDSATIPDLKLEPVELPNRLDLAAVWAELANELSA